MKLLFVANSRIPTERAMGTAIMKQCEAFARASVTVELVVPRRQNVHTENPFLYHGVAENFIITYIWSLDFHALEYVRMRFFIQKLSFFVGLFFYILKTDADILYTREPELIGLLPTSKTKFVELHHLYGLGTLGTFFLSRCTGIITITKALKEDVSHLFNIPLKKMHVAPSGVDLYKFKEGVTKEQARRTLGINTTKPVAVYTGSLEKWKGYGTFLEASKVLGDTVQCVVIGGNDNQVSLLRIEYPGVLFLGFLSQQMVSRNQKAADIFVAPNSGTELISSRYTSPLKVFEYMASGVPIVASATTALSEILSDTNAVLVTPDNSEALAEGIKKVTGDAVFAENIAQQAKKDVVQYDWAVRTSSTLSFLKECM